MRKELTVFLASSEKDIDFSIRRDLSDPSRILLTFEGMKLSFNPEELVEGIESLKQFYNDIPVKRIGRPPKKLTDMAASMFPSHEDTEES